MRFPSLWSFERLEHGAALRASLALEIDSDDLGWHDGVAALRASAIQVPQDCRQVDLFLRDQVLRDQEGRIIAVSLFYSPSLDEPDLATNCLPSRGFFLFRLTFPAFEDAL